MGQVQELRFPMGPLASGESRGNGREESQTLRLGAGEVTTQNASKRPPRGGDGSPTAPRAFAAGRRHPERSPGNPGPKGQGLSAFQTGDPHPTSTMVPAVPASPGRPV